MKRIVKLSVMVVLLAVLIGAYFLVSNMEKEEAPDSGKTYYDATDIEAEAVFKMSYTKDGVQISFEKDDDWFWSENPAVPLNKEILEKMESYIVNLSGLNRIEDVQEEQLAHYGLDEPSLTVSVTDFSHTQTFVFGNYNATIDAYYFTSPDYETTVFTASSSLVEAFDYALTELVVKEELPEIEADKITSVNFERGGESVIYSVVKTPNPDAKENDGTDSSEDAEFLYSATIELDGKTQDFSYAELYRLMEAIGDWSIGELVSCDGKSDKTYGFDSPATLTVKYTQTKQYEASGGGSASEIEVESEASLVLGKYNPDGYFYVKSTSDSPLIYLLPYKVFSELFGAWSLSE